MAFQPKPFTRHHLARATLALCALGSLGAAQAQTPAGWPGKPLRVVVGFAPGGSTDVMARIRARQAAAKGATTSTPASGQ